MRDNRPCDTTLMRRPLCSGHTWRMRRRSSSETLMSRLFCGCACVWFQRTLLHGPDLQRHLPRAAAATQEGGRKGKGGKCVHPAVAVPGHVVLVVAARCPRTLCSSLCTRLSPGSQCTCAVPCPPAFGCGTRGRLRRGPAGVASPCWPGGVIPCRVHSVLGRVGSSPQLLLPFLLL
jgi:hypothetical protein